MKKLLVIALVFALSLSVVFAQAAKEETKVQTASSDFVYDGNAGYASGCLLWLSG